MTTNWIAAFTAAMQRQGRRKHFFIEPCKDHADCVLVQVHKHEEHVQWREHIAAAVARELAKVAG